MMKKIILLPILSFFVVPIVYAQTGLFDGGIAGTFAVTGVTIVVLIIVIKEIFNRFFGKK